MILLELTKTKKQTTVNKISELEFGSDFISTGAISLLCSDGLVMTEVETLHGIPDAVLILKRDVDSLEKLHERFAAVYLTSGHARVMTCLYEKRFQDVASIADRCGLSRSYTKSILKALSERELIYTEGQSYRLADGYGIPKVSIISIEFKLTDWKKALTQAFRHTTFASKSYVIMPSNKKRVLEKNAELFRTYGVSVATYDAGSHRVHKIVDTKTRQHSKISYVDSLFRVINNYERALATHA